MSKKGSYAIRVRLADGYSFVSREGDLILPNTPGWLVQRSEYLPRRGTPVRSCGREADVCFDAYAPADGGAYHMPELPLFVSGVPADKLVYTYVRYDTDQRYPDDSEHIAAVFRHLASCTDAR